MREMDDRKNLRARAAQRLATTLLILAWLLFLPAGSLHFWQPWLLSSTTWLIHLDDALSYLYDDDDNDVLVQVRVAPSSPPSAQKPGGVKPAR